MPDGLGLDGQARPRREGDIGARSEEDEGGSHGGFIGSVSAEGTAGAKAADGHVPSLELIFLP